MKKWRVLTATVILTTTLTAVPTYASDEKTGQVVESEEDVTTIFLHAEGKITKYEQQEGRKMFVVKEDDREDHLLITATTPIFDQTTGERLTIDQVKEGQTVHYYYDRNKPMILIYPAQISPDFVVVEQEKQMGHVFVGTFNEQFVSNDQALELNIDEETIIENQYGKTVSIQELKDQELIVFYTMTTRSLPPQTSPTKVIVFEPQEKAIQTIDEIIRQDFEVRNGTMMIPLRKVAEKLGYEVEVIKGTHSALVMKENLSFTITRDEKSYGYNKSIAQFEQEPFLKNGKTYVPQSFVQQLLANQ